MPGSPSSSTRSGAPPAMRPRPPPRRGGRTLAASRSIKPNGTRIGKPGRPPNAGRTIASGVAPCASTSDVTVSGSTQAYRNGQSSPADVSATAADGGAQPVHEPGDPCGSSGAGAGQRHGRVRRRLGQPSIRVAGHDHDRHRAAGPGRVGDAPEGRLTVGLAEGGGDSGTRTMAATVIGPPAPSVAPAARAGDSHCRSRRPLAPGVRQFARP